MVREGLALGGGLCESLSSGWEEGKGAGLGLRASRRLLLAEAAGPGGRPAVPQLLGLRVSEGPSRPLWPRLLRVLFGCGEGPRGRALPRDGAAAGRERDRAVSRSAGAAPAPPPSAGCARESGPDTTCPPGRGRGCLQ